MPRTASNGGAPAAAGGRVAAGPPGWPPASNLTLHPQGALAGWSEADFLAALRTAHRPNGSEINPAMPRAFGKMTDDELKGTLGFPEDRTCRGDRRPLIKIGALVS